MSRLPLDRASPAVLLQFIEHLSDRLSDVTTAGFNKQTGIVAVVEKIGGGKGSRKIVMFNAGFRTDKPPPPATAGKLVQPGPYLQVRNGRKIHFFRTTEGARIEYDPKRGVITAVEHPDGTRDVFKKSARIRSFGKITVGTNAHHAEGRFLNWVAQNDYKIVVAAPTRGCCAACGSQLRQVLQRDFEKTIPKSRWTQRAFSLHDKARAQPRQTIAAGKPVASQQYVARGLSAEQHARLRAQAGRTLRAFKLPDSKLVRIARVLKVAGPVMVAFDAMTSYARAAEQWHAGAKADAAETMVTFGGRMAGAFVGAETLGLMFGGVGSVVPGLGTTVGALAGAVIGGVVGACVGEQQARDFCHQVFDWAEAHGHDAGRAATASLPGEMPEERHDARPAVEDTARVFTEAPVAELQQQMYESGYGDAEVNFVCETVSARIVGHTDAPPAVTEVLAELASALPPAPDAVSTGEAAPPIEDYPWPEFARDGYEATSDHLFDPPMDVLQADVSASLQDHDGDREPVEDDEPATHETAQDAVVDHAEIVHGVPLTGDHEAGVSHDEAAQPQPPDAQPDDGDPRDGAEPPRVETSPAAQDVVQDDPRSAADGANEPSGERAGDAGGSDDGRVTLDTSAHVLDRQTPADDRADRDSVAVDSEAPAGDLARDPARDPVPQPGEVRGDAGQASRPPEQVVPPSGDEPDAQRGDVAVSEVTDAQLVHDDRWDGGEGVSPVPATFDRDEPSSAASADAPDGHAQPPGSPGSAGAPLSGDQPAAGSPQTDVSADVTAAGEVAGEADLAPPPLTDDDEISSSAEDDDVSSDETSDIDDAERVVHAELRTSDDESDEPGEDDSEDPEMLLLDDDALDDEDAVDDPDEIDDDDGIDEEDDDADDIDEPDDEAEADELEADDIDDPSLEEEIDDDPDEPEDDGFDHVSEDGGQPGIHVDGDVSDDRADRDDYSGHTGGDDGHDVPDSPGWGNDDDGANDDEQDNWNDTNSDDDGSGSSGSGWNDQDDDE